MEVRQEERDSGRLVMLEGDVDMGSSRELRKVFQGLWSGKVSPIVVDLGKVPYIDSSGLATLVECFKEVSKYKGKFALAGMTQNVREVFRLARLDTVLTIFDSVEQAFSG